MNFALSFYGMSAALLLCAWLGRASPVYAADTVADAAKAPSVVPSALPNKPPVTAPKNRVRTTVAPNRGSVKARPTTRPAPLTLDVKRAARVTSSSEKQPLYVFSNTEITPNIRQNLYGPPSAALIEMGDRPARSAGLCGDGKYRRLAELDTRAAAVLLPDISGVRARTICARRGVLIADYSFK